jgi:hypothetical protein
MFVKVVGATGLCGMPAWSQNQEGYVIIAIDRKKIHQTHIIHSGGDPEWKDTFQLYALLDTQLINMN